MRALLLSAVAFGNWYPNWYKISNAQGKYSTEYTEEYFDVYSPLLKSEYSQVIWRMMPSVPLPDEIVARFQNKTMAIRGYEVDQVMRTEKGDVAVPITWAYNHHFIAFLGGKGSYLEYERDDLEARKHGYAHGADGYWTMKKRTTANEIADGLPASVVFSEGNGGEMRGSYHGYPKGYAQLIHAPQTFSVNPMQIDTKNRDHPGTPEKPGSFKAGALPRIARSHAPKDATYSPLVECPCTTRLPKAWCMQYSTQSTGQCSAMVKNSSECFNAVPSVQKAKKYVNRSVADTSLPAGCSIVSHVNGTADAIWNSAGSAACKAQTPSKLVGVAQSIVTVTVAMEPGANVVNVTMVGPADVWFGVGFGATSMCIHPEADECPTGGPYALIVSGDHVEERRLDDHGPGKVLESSVTVVSTVVEDGLRTVVVTRGLKGKTESHYSFDPKAAKIDFINAKGSSLTFAQHKGHAAASLNLLAAEVPTCVCQAGIQGTIGGNAFRKSCPQPPTSDLAITNNPTCKVETYVGGLVCCRDNHLLLDEDQDQPWPNDFLEYQMKFRFYFEEAVMAKTPSSPFEPSTSHKNMVRFYWTTEAFAGEYDIPKCADGTPTSQCIHVITSRWRVRDMMRACDVNSNAWCTGIGSTDSSKVAGVQLIYAGPHCHAATCASMELYNADTGQLLCHMEPHFGQSGERYDENGYISLAPCLWGSLAEGYPEPVTLSLDTNLLSIKRNNNTYYHTGEMASWQMRGIIVPRKTKSSRAILSKIDTTEMHV
jgi:hypothetical protein